MMKTKLLPATMATTVAVLLLTGMYISDEADVLAGSAQADRESRETFLERATRTRANELVARVDSRMARQCQCTE